MLSKISLDYDGVLNNMMTPYLEWLASRGVVTDIKDWDSYCYCRQHFPPWATDFWKYKDTYKYCYPLDGAQQFVHTLRERYPDVEINIVTSTPKECMLYKQEHILSHFSDKCIDAIYHVSSAWDKHKHTKGGVLVDDYFVPLLGHAMKNHEPCILFNYNEIHPWIKPLQLSEVLNHNKHYCTSYKEVLGAIDEQMRSDRH